MGLVSSAMVLPTNRQTHGDLGASVARARVETDTVTTGRAVHLDLARVRLEACSGVFSGDTALNGEAAAVDVLLGETELLEGDTGGDLDLRGDNVDAGDLLCKVSANVGTVRVANRSPVMVCSTWIRGLISIK